MKYSYFRLSLSIVMMACAVVLSSCGVNPTTATRALEAQGMTDVKITGYALFGCAKEDVFASNFSAKGVNGATVEGSVCQGLFKGTTVRFD